MLVDQLAEQYWRLRRVRAYEAQFSGLDVEMKIMLSLLRLVSSAERAFHKTLTTLRSLQRERGFVSAQPQPVAPADEASPESPALPDVQTSGFVPQFTPDHHDDELISDRQMREIERVLAVGPFSMEPAA